MGMTGLQIDKAAEEVVRDHGAVPGFKGYNGFPSTLCVSRNECVVHGIPSDEPFQNGDIVSVDCGSILMDSMEMQHTLLLLVRLDQRPWNCLRPQENPCIVPLRLQK